MNKQEIPIMFCFDNNYVIPAAVTFYSLLENSNKNYFYKMYVLHTDITEDNQRKLKENIQKFSDFSELIFINMENKFEKLWETIATKGHFSKEVMYKVLVASIFPKYDKIIVSDVDVVFLNDISESYFSIDSDEDYYLAGIKMIGKLKWYMDQYLDRFTQKEVEALSGFCGGYIVFNLKKLRQDNMEEKFINCFINDGHRINQMEQDVLNLCCYPKTKRLPLKYLTCSYVWDEYKTEKDKETDIYYTKEEINDAMTNTVQLHYATSRKPWKDVDCTKSEIWFEYLFKTNYIREYLENLPYKITIPQSRIQEIKNIDKQEIIPPKIEKYGFKHRINNKFAKYRWFRALKYIKKNPFFVFKKSFYQKVKEKVMNRINKKVPCSLVIFDDVFPSIYSPFRYEEYTKYFSTFNSVYAFTTGQSLVALSETRETKEVIEEFTNKFPEYRDKVFELKKENLQILKNLKNKIAVITFLRNIENEVQDNLEIIEKYKIPFIFTLYPGGGFILNDEKSDRILKKACSSKYFKKVIVTQEIVKKYLLKKKICNEEQIELIYGVVTPKEILEHKKATKQYYGINKKTLDICFVAHKYSEQGKDKGYDLFIESARKLLKYNNINFHVVGGFDKDVIDVTEFGDRINFYGIQSSLFLTKLYTKMDLLVSPNRPFILSKGSFDGFPTGSATEAMINGVGLICTDELYLNIKFKNNKDLIIIKPSVDEIVEQIEYLYSKPEEIKKLGERGKKKCLSIYSEKNQMIPRINIIKKIAYKQYK